MPRGLLPNEERLCAAQRRIRRIGLSRGAPAVTFWGLNGSDVDEGAASTADDGTTLEKALYFTGCQLIRAGAVKASELRDGMQVTGVCRLAEARAVMSSIICRRSGGHGPFPRWTVVPEREPAHAGRSRALHRYPLAAFSSGDRGKPFKPHCICRKAA
jgi:hypothetical protein